MNNPLLTATTLFWLSVTASHSAHADDYQDAYCQGAAIGSALGLAITGNAVPPPPGCENQNSSGANGYGYQQTAPSNFDTDTYVQQMDNYNRRREEFNADTVNSLGTGIDAASGPDPE